MPYSIFIERNNKPPISAISNAIGTKSTFLQILMKFIRENYHAQEDIKYMYGQKYGWALRFRIKNRLLTAFYPLENGFVVQIILKTEAIKKFQKMKPGKNVAQVIRKSKPYPEGRWLFISVKTKSDIRDIQRLLTLRTENIK